MLCEKPKCDIVYFADSINKNSIIAASRYMHIQPRFNVRGRGYYDVVLTLKDWNDLKLISYQICFEIKKMLLHRISNTIG